MNLQLLKNFKLKTITQNGCDQVQVQVKVVVQVRIERERERVSAACAN